MMEVHPNGAVGEAELFSDLLAAHLLHEPQGERLPIPFGHSAQRAQYVVRVESIRRQSLIGTGIGVLVRQLLRGLRGPVMHAGLVARDRRDPCTERRRLAQCV